MKRILYFSSLLVTFLLVTAEMLSATEEPGARDTVKVSGGPLVVGQSIPISVTIVNDEMIEGYSLPLILRNIGGGFARYDSVVYVDRMADPRVLPYRIVVPLADNVSPDTLHLGGSFGGLAESIPAGNGPILELYLTGLSEGEMAVDSGFRPPAGTFMLDPAPPYEGSIHPEFVTQSVTIVQGTIPTLAVPAVFFLIFEQQDFCE